MIIRSVAGACRPLACALSVLYPQCSSLGRCVRGRALLLRSHCVPWKPRFLPLIFSMALGLILCRLFTARDCASWSSSSVSSSCTLLERKLILRQMLLGFPSLACLTSRLRSQPRGMRATGRALGSRCAVSVSCHVWVKGVGGRRLRGDASRLRGDGTMAPETGKGCWLVFRRLCDEAWDSALSQSSTSGADVMMFSVPAWCLFTTQ